MLLKGGPSFISCNTNNQHNFALTGIHLFGFEQEHECFTSMVGIIKELLDS
jgi:hypothetical protein